MIHADAQKILNLMFREGETISVSNSKYGYHSLPLKNLINNDTVILVPTPASCEKRGIEWTVHSFNVVATEKMTLIALNPIKGWRCDEYCTSYRNFLVELDIGTLDEQLNYIKHQGMPYSAVTFSGNKSLHFLISLDRDLPSESVYRLFSQWILNIINLADPNCKNPSRSIRIPGAVRDNGREQTLLEYNGVVQIGQLVDWLKKYPNSKPIKYYKPTPSNYLDSSKLPSWACEQLCNGIDFKNGRNKTWFTLACNFAVAGVSLDNALTILSEYFMPERDFTEREWESSITSAYKHILKKR